MKKYLIILHVTFTLLLACGGDCIQCHKALEPIINDSDHQILNSCITCHNKPSSHGVCGQDCFTCHDKGKLYADASVKEHQAIKVCYSCHKDNATLLANPSTSNVSSPNRQKPLIEIFK